MINLIPPEGQQTVKREYLLRVGGTLAFLFGGVLLALAVSLLPTYVLVDAQISASASNARKAGADDEQFKSADLEVSRTSAILNQLRKTPPQPPMSAAIEDIRAVAPAGIGFRNFFIEDDAGKVSKVQVQGVAATREVLADFKDALESSPRFETAEVPIADLARDADLPFTVTVTLAKTK